MPVPDAYVQAGFQPDRGNCYRLLNRRATAARIEYLRGELRRGVAEKVANETVEVIVAAKAREQVTRDYVIERLKEVVEISLGKRTVRKKVGGQFVDVYEINLSAATRALELLGKAVGEPFDGSATKNRPASENALAKSAHDPRIVALVRRYQDGSHPSRQFAPPKPEKRYSGGGQS